MHTSSDYPEGASWQYGEEEKEENIFTFLGSAPAGCQKNLYLYLSWEWGEDCLNSNLSRSHECKVTNIISWLPVSGLICFQVLMYLGRFPSVNLFKPTWGGVDLGHRCIQHRPIWPRPCRHDSRAPCQECFTWCQTHFVFGTTLITMVSETKSVFSFISVDKSTLETNIIYSSISSYFKVNGPSSFRH